MKIATIGYEHAVLDGVLAELQNADVELVVDVRAVASSRKAGFSKTVLANSLREKGIDYVQLRALGTPKEGRDAARKGQVSKMHTIYREHLKGTEAQQAYEQLEQIVRERNAALLCYETEASECHRRILTDRLNKSGAFEIQDLDASVTKTSSSPETKQ